jgi:hypothetical protein
MRVAVAGGHGKVAMRLTRLLTDRAAHNTIGITFEVTSGDEPVEKAIAAL